MKNTVNNALIKAFEDAKESVKPTFVGDIVMVGRLPKEELKTAGGIIVTRGGVNQVNAFDSSLPQFVQVLAVGNGFYDGENDVPLDLKPGNVIEVAAHSVSWFSSFGVIPDSKDNGTGVGMTREAEYRIKFDSYDDYLTFMEPFKHVPNKNEEPKT